MNKIAQHHCIERDTGQVRSERPVGDWIVNYLYSKKREEVPFVYQLLGSQWFSAFLGWVNYDFLLGQSIPAMRTFLEKLFHRPERMPRSAAETGFSKKNLCAAHPLLAIATNERGSIGGRFPLRFETSDGFFQRHI
ncbi:MAG TPA: hypothetical protein VEG60_10225 [Candidatus Binatia bacterium]|nr:hypothetical protein [Candidatus Binatia bacterium]